jgi:hypothetical protein
MPTTNPSANNEKKEFNRDQMDAAFANEVYEYDLENLEEHWALREVKDKEEEKKSRDL